MANQEKYGTAAGNVVYPGQFFAERPVGWNWIDDVWSTRPSWSDASVQDPQDLVRQRLIQIMMASQPGAPQGNRAPYNPMQGGYPGGYHAGYIPRLK